jgi:RNA polymerase sigma factor (sigma-70 family)
MPPPAEGFASRLFLGPALRTQPDRRLVTLVRDGYETAFEEIVRRYGRPLTRYAASIVGGRSEDVTQDAFSKALLALRRDDAEIELRPWLFRIVRNTALNDLRDSPPPPEVLAEAIVGGGNPAEELERREELADLMKRLQALPEPQRAAIVMRELEGLGHEEIAAALGLTGGGARQAIYRARQALRDGAGMLIPLPLLQAMLAGSGSGATEAAAGAAGIGSAAGAGVALKATAATVLVAGAVGAGVALKDNSRSGEAKAAPARVSQSGSNVASAPAFTARDVGFEGARHGSEGDSHSRGASGAGENRSGQSGEPGQAGGGSFGAGAKLPGEGKSGGGRGPGPSHSGSSGRDGGDSGASGHLGSSDDPGSDKDGSGSGHDESSLESGQDSHSGPGSGGETEESISSSDGSGDSDDALRDLRESGGLTE